MRELPPVSPEKQAFREHKMAAFRERVAVGGFNEALLRALLFVASAERSLDERSAQALNEVRDHLMAMPIADFKALVREQFYILLLEREAAVKAIATLVTDPSERSRLLEMTRDIALASGPLTLASRQRIESLADLLSVPAPVEALQAPVATLTPITSAAE